MDLDKPLITREDIAKHKEISETVKPKKLNPFILTAQRVDVEPLIGSSLMFDILENPSIHTDLMDGCVYTHDGKKYRNYGLKAVISIYAYARYKYFGSDTDTPYSSVSKLNPSGSAPTPQAQLKSMFTEYQKEAFPIWQNVQAYMIRNNYVGYESGCGKPKRSNGHFKLKLITPNKY